MKKLILLILATFTILNADANLPASTIKNIATGWGGEGLFLSINNSTVVEECVNPRIYVSPTNTMYNEILSIALSSFHASTNVVFRISGCRGENMNGIAISISK
jgi:hypothetical protein